MIAFDNPLVSQPLPIHLVAQRMRRCDQPVVPIMPAQHRIYIPRACRGRRKGSGERMLGRRPLHHGISMHISSTSATIALRHRRIYTNTVESLHNREGYL